MADITLLPSAKVPLIYDGELTMTTEWYRFFWNIYGFTGTGVIPVNKGGTGLDTIGDHQLIIGNANNVFEPALLSSASIAITYPTGFINLELGTSGVTPGTYGSASTVGVFTVNQYGVLTAASNTLIGIDASQIVSGTLPVVRGGTGQSTYTDGQLLIGNSTGNTLTKATLTAGTGISVSNGAGSITIGNTGVLSVSGTAPVVSSGGTTPAISLATAYGDTLNPYASKTANYFLAAPNGSAGVPTFRAMVAADVPALAYVTSVSGTGSVNGITLTGTVTSSGSLTLGGTLSGIGNSQLTNSTISGVALGGNLFNLTAGTGVSFSAGTTYNGSAAITINATGTGGTVTSVAALTIGTTGTDLSSTVANSTTTPVITLNVPTASSTNRGALSSTDWSTFNSKQAALVSGTNIKTVGGVSLLGSGDVGTIGATYGGTGQSVYAVGDILYASTTTALSKLADVATGNALISGGVGVAPSYGKIGLTTHISGTLAVGNGGTGLTSLTAGYIPFGNGTSAFASSSSLFWDSANTRLGVGIATPSIQITAYGSGQNALTSLSTSTGLGGSIGLVDSTASVYGGGAVYFGTGSGYHAAIKGNLTNGTGPLGYLGFYTRALTTDANLTLQMLLYPSGGVSIGNTTDPGATNLSVTGTIIPDAVPSSKWGIDFAPSTGAGSYITLAAGATYDIASGSGMVLLHSNSTGQAGFFICYAGVTALFAGNATIYVSSLSPAASQIGFFYNVGTGKYRITNGYATSQSIFVSTIRTRTDS